MSLSQALIATQRFGLGARPGELTRLADDPKGWLADQIGRVAPLPGIQASPERVVALAEARQELREMKQANQKNTDAFAQVKSLQRDFYLGDVSVRLQAATDSDAPFAERWVRFWSNHFTVSIARPIVSGLVVPFEAEAIRPHVFGRFADLTLAVVRHPAMLLYLDNVQSIGPNSKLGRRREAGLNENLARELMELHTLGVDGGYGQDDVRALANILTGWTVARPGRMARHLDVAPGHFGFAAVAHEPGEKILLGKRYAEGGEDEGVVAIRDVCAHPATARHLARKIARHFLSDNPPPGAVAALEQEFVGSGGDLSAVARRLLTLPDSWSLPMEGASAGGMADRDPARVCPRGRGSGAPDGGSAAAARSGAVRCAVSGRLAGGLRRLARPGSADGPPRLRQRGGAADQDRAARDPGGSDPRAGGGGGKPLPDRARAECRRCGGAAPGQPRIHAAVMP